MIQVCTLPSSGDALAREALAGVDCLISNQVEGGYAALMAPGGTFSTALTIGLTIYVAIIGYRLVLGQAGLTLGELVPHFIKIGLVLALVTSWPAYQTLVFDLLFHGPEQLADALTGNAAAGATHVGILDAVQILFDRLTDYAAAAWGQHAPQAVTAAATATPAVPVAPGAALTPVPPPVAPALPFATLGAAQFVAALLWFAAALMMAASVGVLLVVRIILALLLLLGPVFVALALFTSTRGLFEGWLRTTVKFALVPLFTLPLTAAMAAVAGPLAAELTDAPVTSVRDGPVLLIVAVILVFVAVMWQAARLGGGIASGIRLPRALRPLPVPAPAAASRTSVIEGRLPPAASRAELLVQTIDASGRRTFTTGGGAGPGEILSTRAIAAPSGPAPAVADSGGRLGQGYRRLAIASRPSAGIR